LKRQNFLLREKSTFLFTLPFSKKNIFYIFLTTFEEKILLFDHANLIFAKTLSIRRYCLPRVYPGDPDKKRRILGKIHKKRNSSLNEEKMSDAEIQGEIHSRRTRNKDNPLFFLLVTSCLLDRFVVPHLFS